MNELELHYRRTSIQEMEFTRKIEDILHKISSLDKTQKPVKRLSRNRENNLSAFGSIFPALYITKTPVPFKNRESVERTPKPLIKINRKRKFSQPECLSFDCEKNKKFRDRRKGDDKEKYRRILMLTQRMISKDNLRGWSRN